MVRQLSSTRKDRHSTERRNSLFDEDHQSMEAGNTPTTDQPHTLSPLVRRQTANVLLRPSRSFEEKVDTQVSARAEAPKRESNVRKSEAAGTVSPIPEELSSSSFSDASPVDESKRLLVCSSTKATSPQPNDLRTRPISLSLGVPILSKQEEVDRSASPSRSSAGLSSSTEPTASTHSLQSRNQPVAQSSSQAASTVHVHTQGSLQSGDSERKMQSSLGVASVPNKASTMQAPAMPPSNQKHSPETPPTKEDFTPVGKSGTTEREEGASKISPSKTTASRATHQLRLEPSLSMDDPSPYVQISPEPGEGRRSQNSEAKPTKNAPMPAKSVQSHDQSSQGHPLPRQSTPEQVVTLDANFSKENESSV